MSQYLEFVTDFEVEGTVCPISFVKDVLVGFTFLLTGKFITFHNCLMLHTGETILFASSPSVSRSARLTVMFCKFPYALNALSSTLAAKWNDPEFQQYKLAFPPAYCSSPQSFESHVRDLMAEDLKIPYLKSLQGYLWLKGYESGDLRCPLFPDVTPAMQQWHSKAIPIIIYSSGSVPAQKLLFQYTNNVEAPDLRPLITDYFDTVNAGPKTESKSYEKIAATYPGLDIKHWLFLSDNVKEVEAAEAAGMQSFVVDRPGNAPLSTDAVKQYTVVRSFDSLKLG